MTDSTQTEPLPVRPPRVRITWDSGSSGSSHKQELPFVVGILADLSGARDPGQPLEPIKTRLMLPIDRDNFDLVMQALAPRVLLSGIACTLPGSAPDALMQGELRFASMDDFEPMAIVRRVPALSALHDQRGALRQRQLRADLADVQGLAAMDVQVASIDASIGHQLDAILHAPDFQRLEASWRGLHHLVTHAGSGPLMRLRVFNASRSELLDDLQKAVEFDQSGLFKLLYESEYGTIGGQPFSLLVGDYEIGKAAQDVAFARALTQVAAAAQAPLIMAASPDLFGLGSFADLDRPRELSRIFESPSLEDWQAFRHGDDAAYLTLVLPHVLMRLPYGGEAWPVQGMNYQEAVLGTDGLPVHSKFLWGNAAWMLAHCITRAVTRHGWPAAIRGLEGGGLVDGLPMFEYPGAGGTPRWLCPTELAITDQRDQELSRLGFMALRHCKGRGQAVFMGGQTTAEPKKYIDHEANERAKSAARLPNLLVATRLLHHIKVIMREKIGRFMTRENVQTCLNDWIAKYVMLDDTASQEMKASYPLREARVEVVDVPDEPGLQRAEVLVRLQLQAEPPTRVRLDDILPR